MPVLSSGKPFQLEVQVREFKHNLVVKIEQGQSELYSNQLQASNEV